MPANTTELEKRLWGAADELRANSKLKSSSGDLHIDFHGKAHTAGDIQVFSPSKKVVAAGDTIIGFLPNLGDGYPRPWPRTIDSIAQLKFDRMSQFRNYIEDLTARVEQGKKAGRSLAELQETLTPASLPTLQDHGFGSFVADNLDKYSIYIGQRTPLEDRLTGNITAIFNNLDKA
jgi:hypothetical protein